MLNVAEAILNVTEAMLNVAEAMLKCCRGYDLQYTISRDAIASKKNVGPLKGKIQVHGSAQKS